MSLISGYLHSVREGPSASLRLALLNPATSATPGFRRVGVETCPATVSARLGVTTTVDALIVEVGGVDGTC